VEEATLVRLPLRDLLGRYWQHLRATELEHHKYELQLWNHRACLVKNPGKAPTPPRILDP
jgi:hypothetical protein